MLAAIAYVFALENRTLVVVDRHRGRRRVVPRLVHTRPRRALGLKGNIESATAPSASS